MTTYDNPLYTQPLSIGNLEIPPLDLLEHVLATGGTGSGKTRSFLLPCVERVLQRFGNDPEMKAGMLLIDAKGDMAELASEAVRRSGRTDEPFILGMGGNCWFGLFDHFNGDPTAVSNFLYETLEDRSSGSGVGNESYWHENAKRLLHAAVICAKAKHGPDLGNLKGFCRAINILLSLKSESSRDSDDDDVVQDGTKRSFEKLIDDGYLLRRISAAEKSQLEEYVKHDMHDLSTNTWSCIANMTRNYVAQFSQPDLRMLFEPRPGMAKITPEDIIDRGAMLIVSLSPVIYGDAAAPFRICIKKAFFERVLQRNHLVTGPEGAERPINQTRPILCVMDEFHTTLSPAGRSSDVYFLDRAREFRCMCILATQGISAISSVINDQGMRDHLLNNCRTKFFFGNDCPQTLEYFQVLGGTERCLVQSRRMVRVTAPPRFRLPNHQFCRPASHSVEDCSLEYKEQKRFQGTQIGSLRNGSALVVKKHRELVEFVNDPKLYASGVTGSWSARPCKSA
jgi:hypothetical protein